jgi:hypothetical protein
MQDRKIWRRGDVNEDCGGVMRRGCFDVELSAALPRRISGRVRGKVKRRYASHEGEEHREIGSQNQPRLNL